MGKEKPRVAIVGLGLIGSSIGLALRQADVAFTIVGHDKERDVSARAKKLGAVDRADWNLISACEESDLVILSIPVGAIESTLEAIGPYLRPGCVVMDTAALKGPVMAWADTLLPEGIHFVGGNPIVQTVAGGGQGVEAAREDLFQNGLFCLIPAASADAEAVKLATDLVGILGAKPLFLDAAEHDGLLAAVDHLPAALALALLGTVVHQPHWRELRKVAGARFEAGTQLALTDLLAYSDLLVSNRDNMLRWIDAFSASLASLRQSLVAGDPEALFEQFQDTLVEREKWFLDRAEGLWYEGPQAKLPERPNMMETFLGTFWRRDTKKDRGD